MLQKDRKGYIHCMNLIINGSCLYKRFPVTGDNVDNDWLMNDDWGSL